MEPSPDGERAVSGTARGSLQVLVATCFYAGVAPVAKLVELDAAVITFWRAAFGAFSLALFLVLRGGQFRVRRSDLASLFWMGLLMAGNWYFFLLSAKLSTVAIAVVCLFTYPLITALIEPWYFPESRRVSELAGGALVVLGCVLLVDRFTLTSSAAQGALTGIASALCLSFRNLLNRRAVARYSSSTLTFYQFVVATILFVPALLSGSGWPSAGDLPLLFLIGGVLTTFSHVLFTASLAQLSASRASLLLSLQPIFAVLLAALLLGEIPSARIWIGGALILLAALLPHATRSLAKSRA